MASAEAYARRLEPSVTRILTFHFPYRNCSSCHYAIGDKLSADRTTHSIKPFVFAQCPFSSLTAAKEPVSTFGFRYPGFSMCLKYVWLLLFYR